MSGIISNGPSLPAIASGPSLPAIVGPSGQPVVEIEPDAEAEAGIGF